MRDCENLKLEISQYPKSDILTTSNDPNITFDVADGVWGGAYNT